MTAAALASWAVDALVASTLLIAAVMLVRVPVRRAFGPGIAYLLWALPLLRLLLPPMPAGWRAAAAMPISRAGESITVLVVEAGGGAADPSTGGAATLWPWALALWGAGALAFLLFHIVRHARFCGRLLERASAAEWVEGVRVVTSDAAPGPLAFGIWRRYVAFPRDFAARYDADERALALAHELGHHQRGDLLANWLALAVLAVHWFNPLAWRAFRAFRADQELANDARVLAGRAATLRHAYGRAIVKAAHGGAVSPACHLHTIADLKGRLRMLTRSPASRRRLASGATTVAVLVVAGLGLTASGSGAAAITTSVREAVGVPQVPPAPPAPPSTLTPPAPPLPPAPAAHGRKAKRVVVVRNGDAHTYEGADADRYLAENGIDVPVPPVPPVPGAVGEPTVMLVKRPSGVVTSDANGRKEYRFVVPDVRSMRCPGDDASQPTVWHQGQGDRQRIVICTNRIEAMTRNAQQMAQVTMVNAGAIEQQARISARAGLSVARTAIARDRNLTDDQRRQALAGVAQAEAELASAND